MITFLYPYFAWLILLPLVVKIILPFVKGSYGDALTVPFAADFADISAQSKAKNISLTKAGLTRGFWACFLIYSLLVLAAMRPVQMGEPVRISNEGRDILIVTDISTSMLEEDFSTRNFRLSRLNAVKAVVSEFVKKRQDDRIGLILFGTQAYLQAPLTYDRQSVLEILNSVDAGMAGNSTAIGDALGLALKSLKDKGGELNRKVIILLTDGENNDGKLSLPEAADMAAQEGVKIYTIGVGSGRQSLINAFFGGGNASLDEKSLKHLAAETEGRYFRADDLKGLVNVYKAIDLLEPESSDENFVYPRQDLYYLPLLAAILLAAILMYVYQRKGE